MSAGDDYGHQRRDRVPYVRPKLVNIEQQRPGFIKRVAVLIFIAVGPFARPYSMNKNRNQSAGPTQISRRHRFGAEENNDHGGGGES